MYENYSHLRRKFAEYFIENETYNFLEDYYKHKLPRYYDTSFCNSFSSMSLKARDSAIELCGFLLVNKDMCEDLAEFIGNGKCLEVMAGLGSLSYGLRQEVVDIITTDLYIDHPLNYNNIWCDIEQIDAVEAVRKYGKDVDYVIMSWPRGDEKHTAYQVAKELYKIDPNKVLIYIGEQEGGCCADEMFFAGIEYTNKNKFDCINTHFSNWYWVHDQIYTVRWNPNFTEEDYEILEFEMQEREKEFREYLDTLKFN